MAAAGGNNWVPWDIVRLFNPDFRLDAKLKADFASGKLSEQAFDAFNSAGISISSKATLSPARAEYDGIAWNVEDGTLTHVVRDLPWMNSNLEVYLAQSTLGLADMPNDITFSLTMRRALRVKGAEGRVLEDVGIAPDIIYRMTLRDLMEKNQDLFEFACKELILATAAS
jgi:hypothetical protein